MLTLFRTLKFFTLLLTKKAKPVPIKTIQLTIRPHYVLETDLYQEQGHYRGTIFFPHGMNKHGKNDERLKFFCYCLAHVGYRVVVPDYPTIRQHIIDLACIDEVADTIAAVTADPQICPRGKVAIFTVSLSGFLAIKAASYPQTAHKVSAFFTVGSAFYARTVFHVGMELAHDGYMKMICLKNVLRSDPSVDREIINAMDAVIADAFEPDQPPQTPAALAKLSPESREFLEKLIAPGTKLSFLYQRYLGYLTKLEEIYFSNGDNKLLSFPIIFMHSVNDNVFPPEETLRFSRYLTEQHVKHIVFLTSLMEHVDHALSIKKIHELLRMIWLFNLFFKSA